MDTKVSNQSVPVEQVSNAEDVHNVTAQVQPEEVVATVNAEEPEVEVTAVKKLAAGLYKAN